MSARSRATQEHEALLISSFRRVTGRDLPRNNQGSLFDSPAVVVSHGTQDDPILNYGNRVALDLWEMSSDQLTSTPSRQTAEPVHRDERARLLARVTRDGYIDDYSGIRISATGRRFRIDHATVWNVLDEQDCLHGQAATFSDWTFL